MPVAPYGTPEYRQWNAERMRRRRLEGAPWERRYEESERGAFMRSTYESSVRRMILRGNCDHGGELEPRETVSKLNERRALFWSIRQAGGFEAWRAQNEVAMGRG